jgi:hypothetical protein
VDDRIAPDVAMALETAPAMARAPATVPRCRTVALASSDGNQRP